MGTIQFNDSAVLFGDSAGDNTDKVAFHEDCCCGKSCDDCTDPTPLRLQVDFTNVTNNNCLACVAYYAQSFILDQTENPCIWEFIEDDWCAGCGGGESTSTHITAQYIKIGANYFLRVYVAECHCCGAHAVEVQVASFEKAFETSEPPCIPASPITVPAFDLLLWRDEACTWDDTVVRCTVSAV